MGSCCCTSSKEAENKIPVLILYYERGNEEQHEYCIKLVKKFRYNKNVRFDMNSIPQVPYGIKIRINKEIFELERAFDGSDLCMDSTLNRAYALLREHSV